MSLNGLPVVAPPARPKTAPSGTLASSPLLNERQGKYLSAETDSDKGGRRRNGSRRGSGGLADAMYKSLRELGFGTGSGTAVNDSVSIQRRIDMGYLMQTLFQAVQTHAPTLANGDASSFASALASVATHLSGDDSLRLALGRVLHDLHRAQPGGANRVEAIPTPHDLLVTLQRNLKTQTNVVHVKGNVVNSRA